MSATRQVHVIGAGMAGLSAALQLTLAGEKVTVYEAAPFAGGRCRSFLDRDLGCRIDNGNHLVLSGNAAIHDYLFLTNAVETMGGPGKAAYPFIDINTGESWIAHMNNGYLPWWIFAKNRRVAGTKAKDYLSALDILTAADTDTVAERLDPRTTLYKRFWEPMTIGVLNTEPGIASARLLANVLWQSFAVGGHACIPLIPKIGLSESFVLPCVNVLTQHGTEIKYSHRLGSIGREGGGTKTEIRRLGFANNEVVEIGSEDWVILALPAWVARELLPEISTPTDFRSIINAHYRVEVPDNAISFNGFIGGVAEWCFIRNGIASVTISCAERYSKTPVRDMAALAWRDLAKLYGCDPEKVPPHKIFKEKYATFAATPEQDRLRPSAYTGWKNLALAGEWTATGLPSTIEGAIRSGLKAAQIVMRWS